MQAVVDRKSTRLNSSHTVIYTLSLHDALPISVPRLSLLLFSLAQPLRLGRLIPGAARRLNRHAGRCRSEEHTSELQSHSDLHSFPTRRSSDLCSTLVSPFVFVSAAITPWASHTRCRAATQSACRPL